MDLWGRIRDWWDTEADQLTYVYLAEGDALPANASYFRVWMADMFLAHARTWAQDQWPAVHATVQLACAGKEQARFTKVVQPPRDQLGNGVRNNYHLTPLLPFAGGIVEIESALVRLSGPNPIKTAISVLEDFSSLVGPPLASAISIADKVSSGVAALAATAGGDVELGLHQSLVGAGGNIDNTLRPGYLVVVNAPASAFDSDALSVSEGRLHGADKRPLTGYDYMVFGIEHRSQRDDYDRLFKTHFDAAMTAAILGGQDADTKAKELYIAVLNSHELTQADQQIQIAKYRKILAEVDPGAGLTPDNAFETLDDLLATYDVDERSIEPMTLEDALAL